MPATYEPIATTTLGSAAATITFSSIPATYTDLKVILVSLSSTTNTQYLQFNGDTGSNYSQTNLVGSGTTATSGRTTNLGFIRVAAEDLGSTTLPTLVTIDVMSYANTSINKTTLISTAQDFNGSGYVYSRVGLWRSTSAINQIVFGRSGGNYSAGTTATLYGILKA